MNPDALENIAAALSSVARALERQAVAYENIVGYYRVQAEFAEGQGKRNARIFDLQIEQINMQLERDRKYFARWKDDVANLSATRAGDKPK